MRSIDVGIGHNYNFMVSCFRNITLSTNSGTDGLNHSLNFLISFFVLTDKIFIKTPLRYPYKVLAFWSNMWYNQIKRSIALNERC